MSLVPCGHADGVISRALAKQGWKRDWAFFLLTPPVRTFSGVRRNAAAAHTLVTAQGVAQRAGSLPKKCPDVLFHGKVQLWMGFEQTRCKWLYWPCKLRRTQIHLQHAQLTQGNAVALEKNLRKNTLMVTTCCVGRISLASWAAVAPPRAHQHQLCVGNMPNHPVQTFDITMKCPCKVHSLLK